MTVKTPRETVDNSYAQVLTIVQGQIKYYEDAKKTQKICSKGIRLFSIIFIGLGGIIPLLKEINDVPIPSNYGYVSLAIAGTLLFLDRCFGFSTAWIRCTTTEMEIERQKKAFCYKMDIELAKIDACGIPLTCDKMVELLNVIKDFVSQIDELVKQETQSWATEFQSNMAELMKLANAKAAEMKPGSIRVVIKNTAGATISGMTMDSIGQDIPVGSEALISNVSPGPHNIILTGEKAGDPIIQSAAVNVEAGKMAKVDIELK